MSFQENLQYYPSRFVQYFVGGIITVFLSIYLGANIGDSNFGKLTMIGGILLIAVSIMFPRIFLVLLAFTGIWSPESFGHGGMIVTTVGPAFLRLGDFFAVVCFFFLMFDISIHKEVFKTNYPLNRIMTLWYAWGSVIMLIGIYKFRHSGIGEAREIFVFTIFYMVIPRCVRDVKDLKFLLIVWILFAIPSLLVPIYNEHFKVIPNYVDIDEQVEIVTEGLIPGLGFYLASIHMTCVLMLLSLMLHGFLRRRFFFIPLVIYILAVFIFCFVGTTRTMQIGALASLPVVFLLVPARRTQRVLFIIAGIIGGICLLLTINLLVDNKIFEALAVQYQFAIDGSLQGSADWRWTGWTQYWERCWESPWIGHPFGDYIIWDTKMGLSAVHPHNDYLFIFGKMGLPGVLLFICLGIAAFHYGLQYIKKVENPFGRALMVGFLGSVAYEYAAAFTFGKTIVLWISLGLMSLLPKFFPISKDSSL